MVGALAFSAGGAEARGGGGCGPCYFVGITPAPGGSPEVGGFQGGGFQANTAMNPAPLTRTATAGYSPYEWRLLPRVLRQRPRRQGQCETMPLQG